MNPFPSVRTASSTRDAVVAEISTSLRPLFPLWRYGVWAGAFVFLMLANLMVHIKTQSYLAQTRTYEHSAEVSQTELGQLALELDVRRGAAHLQQAATMYGLTTPVAVETVAVSTTDHDADVATP